MGTSLQNGKGSVLIDRVDGVQSLTRRERWVLMVRRGISKVKGFTTHDPSPTGAGIAKGYLCRTITEDELSLADSTGRYTPPNIISTREHKYYNLRTIHVSPQE